MDKMTRLTFLMILCLGSVLTFSTMTRAATYYIDFSSGSDSNTGLSKTAPWKRSPGMNGFAGRYVHSVGDIFVFKGAATWPSDCFPMTIKHSGAGGKPDTYTADKTWFQGEKWTYPVFDGEGRKTGLESMIRIMEKDHITVDSIKIYRTGVKGGNGGGRPIQILNGSFITISNMIFDVHSHHAIVVGMNGSIPQRNLEIKNCDFGYAANSIEVGAGRGRSARFTGIFIHDNTFHDPHDMLVKRDHGDGIHIHGHSSPDLTFENVKIYNNRFYGDWGSGDGTSGCTAQIYLEDGIDGGEIYNNVVGFDNTTTMKSNYMFSPGLIYLKKCRNVDIHHNTVSSDGLFNAREVGAKSAVVIQDSSDVRVMNNIFSRTTFGIIGAGTFSFTADNNVYWPRPGGEIAILGKKGRYRSFAQWQAAGYDKNGKYADPMFVNAASPPFDLRLRKNSPAAGAGCDFNILSSDRK